MREGKQWGGGERVAKKGGKEGFALMWHIYTNLKAYITIYAFNMINYVYIACDTHMSLNSIIHSVNGGDLYEEGAVKRVSRSLSHYYVVSHNIVFTIICSYYYTKAQTAVLMP